jgi:hypothetical protein
MKIPEEIKDCAIGCTCAVILVLSVAIVLKFTLWLFNV